MREVVLGADLGTSSIKGVAVTPEGDLLARAHAEYPMHRPHRGWNENDPRDWLAGLRTVVDGLVRELDGGPERVRALAIVAQRDPLVLLDAAGEPVAPAISWTDQRTALELTELEGAVGRDRLIEVTGGRPVVGGGLLNVMWARRHEPEAWARTRRLAAPKDYLLGILGGRRGTDPTTPTRSIAFDVRAGDWSAEILAAARIDAALFDPVGGQAGDRAGELGPAAAADLGLPVGTPLAIGCADDHAAAIGSGATAPGDWSVGTGTCSSWRRVIAGYQPDPEGRFDCSPHAVPGLFIHEATIDSVGSTLRWFRDELLPGKTYEEILDLAASVPDGAEGAWCLPFVDGAQRAPWFAPEASAAFLGISGRHTTAHLARAVIESVAYLYVPTYELMGGDGDEVLTIVDGEAASGFWNQLKADVLGRPVRTPVVLDAAAMGAAALGAVAAGLHPDLPTAVEEMIAFRAPIEPDPRRHAAYAERQERFTGLCRAVLAASAADPAKAPGAGEQL
ncbi:MAG TPA: FGGY family carbohydrate kinase [Solirubrobacterales bacterium]|nr:FGGY family carbohydrate kinase [Solirubrobacterales bacterium]